MQWTACSKHCELDNLAWSSTHRWCMWKLISASKFQKGKRISVSYYFLTIEIIKLMQSNQSHFPIHCFTTYSLTYSSTPHWFFYHPSTQKGNSQILPTYQHRYLWGNRSIWEKLHGHRENAIEVTSEVKIGPGNLEMWGRSTPAPQL